MTDHDQLTPAELSARDAELKRDATATALECAVECLEKAGADIGSAGAACKALRAMAKSDKWLSINPVRERFARDPVFRVLVAYFEATYHRGACSVDDIRQAATYAAIRCAMRAQSGMPSCTEEQLEDFRRGLRGSGGG